MGHMVACESDQLYTHTVNTINVLVVVDFCFYGCHVAASLFAP